MRMLGVCRIISIMSTNKGRKSFKMNRIKNGPKMGPCRGIFVPKGPENRPKMARNWAGIERNGTGGPGFIPSDLKG